LPFLESRAKSSEGGTEVTGKEKWIVKIFVIFMSLMLISGLVLAIVLEDGKKGSSKSGKNATNQAVSVIQGKDVSQVSPLITPPAQSGSQETKIFDAPQDAFAQNTWYETDFIKRKMNRVNRDEDNEEDEKRSQDSGGTFIVFPGKVDVIEVGKATTPNISGIPSDGTIKVSELELYRVGEYKIEEEGKVCWSEHVGYDLGPATDFLLCENAFSAMTGSRDLRGGEYITVGTHCRRSGEVGLCDDGVHLGTLSGLRSGREPCGRNAQARYGNSRYEWSQTRRGRKIRCAYGMFSGSGMMDCWILSVPKKIHNYRKLCVARDSVILGRRESIDQERIKRLRLLRDLSQTTIRNLLEGRITPGMTPEMSEVALGEPRRVRKEFDPEKGQIEIRCYGNCGNEARRGEHFLELKFIGGVLESWSEG
jgi:hypothetical protein